METEAEEKTQEPGELDDLFVTLAEDEDGWGIIRCITRTGNFQVYTGRKSERGRFYKLAIPQEVFFDLARAVLAKVDAGEIEVE